MTVEYRMVVEFVNDPIGDPDDEDFVNDYVRTKRYAKPTQVKALADAADLRIAIAGGESKRAIKTNGLWHLAPYWAGATVTVEEREIGPWGSVDEEATP